MKAQNKTMKTIITSNSRPLCRALCTVLIGIAAVWAMFSDARAQLYVSNQGNTVSEYNATTGGAIKPSFITGLSIPFGLAVSGNALFVASDDGNGSGTVGEYNATTGAAINANLVTGLDIPNGLAVSGNDLFVTNGGSTVGEYNATTGAAINAGLITVLGNVTDLAVSGKALFVTNDFGDMVGEYNLTTGAFNPASSRG